MKSIVEALQPIGRALMLPIAVLPVAGLLLRLGQPDLLDIGLLAAAGDALFNNLGLLFAIGVACGIARDGNGAACLAGVVCYLVVKNGGPVFLTVPPEVTRGFDEATAAILSAAWKAKAFGKLDVPIGIVSGLIGGSFYNRFATIKVPEYLAFFGGRRFVPIVSGLAGVGIAMLLGLSFSGISTALDLTSRGLVASGSFGLFGFGLLNRLLLVTGLHHILNNVAWFVLGDFNGTTGDLRRFFAGDPHAGAFMAGFFPIMMFGLPAACLAMYRSALPDRRKAVGGMLLSLALTSFLTGVTEPIEFSFMFLAPILYAIHAVLTGVSMAVMDALGVRLGFGFSAGLFDYVLNYGKATKPLLLLPIGAVYFAVYYGVFRFFIVRFDLKTPGRDASVAPMNGGPVEAGERGRAFLAALGGTANLASIGACTTRLRLVVADQALVDEAALKALGAMGVIRPSDRAVQVIVGPIADQVAEEIREAGAGAPMAAAVTQAPAPVDAPVALSSDLLAALGGTAAVAGVQALAGRVRVELREPCTIDPAILPGIRAARQVAPTVVHLLV
ncbi:MULTISPECIES: N-acetylglucosamine-specific PTS transporter subunit IIBC [unclassified Sphingomonas]|uniref:N-acetylglucosamine-specific PTS transporter subunit IIBC n=1 Tax=unclassified Sphingomonas TaxID=196159 RepID=UPI00070193ED|nr:MULTISPECIES: N-acetylglucosamine-specific PTS transporter subunit IIBC [unclassified Sphingomonas]KQM61942.1 PTS N-acetyl-D-glucosamine transporter [Sphingomonas sp. Leaf16]KQN13215.1 PTS N-acetyl-D-glucosamine transporter [Sphingomonas sp. Leaf29]KQN20100.1 PTS N-acetyl-D-glucosamine transporter [Sphingomonas sp. Leaf32]